MGVASAVGCTEVDGASVDAQAESASARAMANARMGRDFRFMLILIPPKNFMLCKRAKKKPLFGKGLSTHRACQKPGKQACSFPPKKTRSFKGRSSGLASFPKRAFPCGAQWHLRLKSALQQRGLQRIRTVFPFQRPLETGGTHEPRYSIRLPNIIA